MPCMFMFRNGIIYRTADFSDIVIIPDFNVRIGAKVKVNHNDEYYKLLST